MNQMILCVFYYRIVRLIESGIYNQWILEASDDSSGVILNQQIIFIRLTIETLIGVFYLYFIGVSLSLIVFGCERYANNVHKVNDYLKIFS
jgi:hypothetical protein